MKHAGDTRKPYSGLSRSLVIAIDVGTTFSGVSYAILEPGEIPKIHGVTRFPGQEHVAGNSKIPSVIYYDKHGKMMAAGAEADTSSVLAQAEEDGWIKAELFKLRLRPRTMTLNMNGMRLGLLPKRKTAVHVFGDFLAYMYRCTRNFITDTHANGAALWNAVEHDLQFVLSHPNGWEGAQQTKMRRAAVYGGLIPDSNEGKARIRFVTEGEASLHACVLNGLAADVLSNPSKHGFLIADAGGGTLDISAYAIRGTSPLVMEEIAPPDCIFAGSVFVSRRAREFLEEKLKKSKYGTPDALDHITRRFDETTKRLFRDRREMQFIPFGSPLDKDPNVGIRAGQLKLTGNEVANLFEPSVDAAVNAIKAQIEASQGIIKSVFLVGGYAASPWLFNQLQERLAPLRVSVNRPDTQTSKAVADGAIGFYCDHHVSARMSKFMYGVEFLRELNPADPDHVARRERLCELPSGPKLLPDAFDCILARSVKVKESTVFTRKYCTELTNLSMLSVFEVEIWCYRGGNTIPKWINRQADDFSTLCVVRADLSPLSGSAEPKTNRNGKTYWTIVFSVEIHFGLTEFKARIKWVDNGTTKYGPASIVYNERGHRSEEEEPDNIPEDDAYYSPRDRERDRERERDRDRTRDMRSEPVSRARTPTDPYYVESRRTSASRSSPRAESMIPEVARVERTASKHSSSGYASAPTGSDSDRRRTMDKGKERERERDSRVSTPRHSTPGKIADVLSSTWDAPAHTSPIVVAAAAAVHSRSPSIRDRDPGPTSIFDNPPPKSPSGGKSSWDDALGLDRTRSIGEAQSYFDAPPGDAPQLSWDAPKTPSADKSPFGQKKKSIFDDPVLPEEPPKSAFGGDASRSIFGDAPKSVFGDAPKSPFGDASRSPFGDASRSVFGDAPKSPWEATRERKISTTSNIVSRNSPAVGANRSPFGKAPEPAFEDIPAVAAAPSSPGTGLFGTTKSASKNASPIKPLSPLNPASQLHTPAVETLDPWDMGAGGNAQATTGASDMWSTEPVQSLHVEIPEQAPPPKSPSVIPQEVAPVEQVKEPEPEQEAVTPITPGGKKKKKKGAAGGASESEKEKKDKEKKEKEEKEAKEKAEREEKEKVEREKAEKEKIENEKREQEARQKEEEDHKLKEEEERKLEEQKLKEEIEKAEKEEERKGKEEEDAKKAKEEEEKKAREEEEKRLKEEEEKRAKEEEKKAEEEKSKALPPLNTGSSLFGDSTWDETGANTGDDSGWGFGTTVTTKKKNKKGSNATTPKTSAPATPGWGTSKPAGMSFGWGGATSAFGSTTTPAIPEPEPETAQSQGDSVIPPSTQPPGSPALVTLDAAGADPKLDDIDLTGDTGAASKGASKTPSRAPSPNPAAETGAENGDGEKADLLSPTGEGGEAAGEGDAGGDGDVAGEGDEEKKEEEDGWGGVAVKGKKKKKGGKKDEEAEGETKEDPPAAVPAPAGSKKKKKGKK